MGAAGSWGCRGVKKAIAWVIDGSAKVPQRLAVASVPIEARLEDWIDADIGIDADGGLVVIELKRDQTPRETVAQGLGPAPYWDQQLVNPNRSAPIQDPPGRPLRPRPGGEQPRHLLADGHDVPRVRLVERQQPRIGIVG